MFAITNADGSRLPLLLQLMDEAGMQVCEAQLKKELLEDRTARAMVMELDGPAGFCLWNDVPGVKGKTMEIRMVYLKQELRGQRLGALLFENLARIAEMEGMEAIRWDAAFGDKWAGGFGKTENGTVSVSAEKIPQLWGHCHCHDHA